MPTTSLLVRYNGGWTTVEDAAAVTAYGRIQARLDLGAIQTEAEAIRVATRELSYLTDVRTQFTVTQDDDTDTTLANFPYLAYTPGDTITVPGTDLTPTAERVFAITIEEDDNGNLTAIPELKDLILDAAERFEQDIRKMNQGALGGATSATPFTG